MELMFETFWQRAGDLADYTWCRERHGLRPRAVDCFCTVLGKLEFRMQIIFSPASTCRPAGGRAPEGGGEETRRRRRRRDEDKEEEKKRRGRGGGGEGPLKESAVNEV